MIKLLCELAAQADDIKFTLLKVDNDQFMVVVQPSTKLAKTYPAFASPLQVIETADKLEAELYAALTAYVPALTDVASNINAVVNGLKKEADDLRAETKAKKEADLAKKQVKLVPPAKAVTTSRSPPPMPPAIADMFEERENRTSFMDQQLVATGEDGDAGNSEDGQ